MYNKASSWESIQKYIQDQFSIQPNVYNILFLIGVQEMGYGFQQLDQATKTKVINFASIYIMNFLKEEDKKILQDHDPEKNYYEEEIYKTGIINYFESKKII